MSYTLYGTVTSPFTRRIRMLLGDISHQFLNIDPYSKDEAQKLNDINPLNQIPVLIDSDKTVYDSRQIFNYLNEIHQLQKMDLEKENLLTVIDGLMNAGVTLMQLRRSGFSEDAEFMLKDRSQVRVESSLKYLENYLKHSDLLDFNFHSMSLIAFLEWAEFRNILKFEKYPTYEEFLKHHSKNPIVVTTRIPENLKT